jgi:hypothetical protein
MENFTFKGLVLKGLIVFLGLVFFTSVNLQAQTTERTTIAKHTLTKPVIDGVADAVWAKADSAAIDATGSHWGPGLSNADDFVGTIKTLWNGNDLYLLVKVTDDELKRTMNWASGDYYQISLDVNNLDATDYSTSGHFWALRGGWNDPAQFVGRSSGQVVDGVPWTPSKIEYFSIVDSVKTGDYWTYYTTLEIRFPCKDLGLVNTLAEGSIVGLDAYIQDLDNDGTSVWCYDGSDGWNNPSSNGNVLMSAEEASIIYPERTTIAKHTLTKPVIDGVEDAIWANANSALVDTTGWNWGPVLSNSDDFVGTIKTLWNGNDLYMLLKVTDDELKRTLNWASGDYFQISLDVNNTGASDYSTTGHFWAIRGGWNTSDQLAGRSPGQIVDGVPWTPSKIEYFSIVDSVKTGDYWTYYTTLEIRFPCKDLGLVNTLADGSIVGLDAYLQDLDNDGTSVWCYYHSDGWNDPSSNGNVLMSAEEVTTSVSSLKKSSDLAVYPNPVSDRLNISNSSGLKMITISDILGKTVISINANQSSIQTIDLSTLHSGIYFVKAVSNENTITTRKIIKR